MYVKFLALSVGRALEDETLETGPLNTESRRSQPPEYVLPSVLGHEILISPDEPDESLPKHNILAAGI